MINFFSFVVGEANPHYFYIAILNRTSISSSLNTVKAVINTGKPFDMVLCSNFTLINIIKNLLFRAILAQN